MASLLVTMPWWLVGAVASLDLFWAIALTVAWLRTARELRELLALVDAELERTAALEAGNVNGL